VSRFSLLLIIGLYFVTRFFNLNALPIFNDEAIYLHWGQIMVNVPGQAFYSLFDGKPPLVLWFLGYFQKLPLDPLIAGRTLSIIFGALTLWGVLKVCQLLKFSTKAQLIAGLFYILNPLTLFFDRLALLDSPVSAIFIWVLYFSLKISQLPIANYQLLITLGLVQATGLWIKGTTKIFLFLPFIIPLITLIIEKDKKKAGGEALLFFISLCIAQILFLPLRFQPLFSQFSKREGDFLLPITQALQPSNWLPHLHLAFFTFLLFLTPLVLLLNIFGFLKLYRKETKASLILILFSLLPLGFEVLTARYFFSRYFLFTFLPLLILAAVGLENLRRAKNFILAITLLITISISISLLVSPLGILKTISKNKVLAQDINQYYTGWTSGYGVKEAANWIKNQSQKESIVVLVRADSGNPEDAIFVYLAKERNIILAQATRKPTTEELDPFKKFPIYFVSRGEQYLNMRDQLEEKVIFKKPLDSEFVGIYQIKN